jgi:HAE1 family hydrophobic/amphiphilic exporter-1
LRTDQVRLAVARANLVSRDQTTQLTEWRNQARLVSGLEVNQARSNAEQTRSTVPALIRAIEDDKLTLALLVGLPRKDVEALLKNYQLPPGYTWKLGKGFDQQDENSQTMMFNLLLAIAMIYLVMAAVFESTVYPMSIITSIFMAIVGVIWLLFLTRTTVTLMAFIGVQILIGVVVNIGIVLVAHINELRSKGMERMAAIVQAGRDRLRPILMTTLTASLGLLPLAAGDASLAVGGGGPSYAPMARSIMGGLLAGAVMSLFVVPAFYVWIDNGSQRVKRFLQRTRVVDAPAAAPALSAAEL